MATKARDNNLLADSGTASSDQEVRTVIVSWHWPPTSRASAGVLGALFSAAPPGRFRVVTRSFPNHRPQDRRDAAHDLDDRVPPTYVLWPLDDQAQPSVWQFLTVIRTVVRMMRAATKVGREFNAQRVCAVYPHRFSLLAGWLTARRLRLPLVIYMHDLLAEAVTFRNPLRRAFWKIVDHIALRSAWLVIVPTREFAEHYRKRGITRTWVLPHTTTSPHNAEPERLEATANPRAKTESLHLIYAGAIYEPHADAAQAFIAATERIQNLRVTYLAPANACGGLLGRVGARWLHHRDAMKELTHADAFVVLLGSDTSCPEEVHGCFPSKIIDYLSVARPILAVVPRGCFVDRLVSEHGCGVVARDNSSDEIGAAIQRLRDPNERQKMSQAASQLAGSLHNEIWMERLSTRLGEEPELATAEATDRSFRHCIAD